MQAGIQARRYCRCGGFLAILLTAGQLDFWSKRPPNREIVMRKPAAKCRALNQAAPIDGATVDATRRKVLGVAMAGAAIAMGGAASSVYAQSAPKIRVGYWPIAAG